MEAFPFERGRPSEQSLPFLPAALDFAIKVVANHGSVLPCDEHKGVFFSEASKSPNFGMRGVYAEIKEPLFNAVDSGHHCGRRLRSWIFADRHFVAFQKGVQ